MLGILSDIESRKAEAAQAHRACKFGHLLMGLSEEERAAVNHAITLVRDDSSRPQSEKFFTIVWLQDLLVSNGYPIGKTVVSEHVRKVCTCESSQ